MLEINESINEALGTQKGYNDFNQICYMKIFWSYLESFLFCNSNLNLANKQKQNKQKTHNYNFGQIGYNEFNQMCYVNIFWCYLEYYSITQMGRICYKQKLKIKFFAKSVRTVLI